MGFAAFSLDERSARIAAGLLVWLAACAGGAGLAGAPGFGAAAAAAAPVAWCLGLRPFWRMDGGVLAAGAGFVLVGVALAGLGAAPLAGLPWLLLGPALAAVLGRDVGTSAAASVLGLAAAAGLQAGGPPAAPLLEEGAAWALAFAGAAGVAWLLLLLARPNIEPAPPRASLRSNSILAAADTAALAHELRTPLHQILGFAEVIEERMFGDAPDRYAEYAGHIRSSGRHMLQLADRWLLAARLDAAAWSPKPEAFDLAALAVETVEGFSESAARAGVRLQTHGLDQPAEVEADPQAWRQVLTNLIANALKFTPTGGQVRVSLAGEGRRGVVVEDSGPGVPEAERARLLAPFARGAAAAGKDGVGLGLSIVQRLLRAQGCRLRIGRSVDLGGARFEASGPPRRWRAATRG
jgi:cell cycle sensor histidine kinase DivJ